MALETGQYISDLVVANPQSTDAVSQADDHIRLIKNTIKNTFPNVTGPVTKTQAQINDALEKAGGTMTGPLVLSGAPTVDLHAATKAYVDGINTSLSSAKADKTTTITAGTGLTGGGDLSANRTVSIAAGGVGSTQLADSGVTTAKIADSAVTPAKLSQKLTLDTALSTTAGNIRTFNPPSWARRITVIFNGVSTNAAGGAALLVQIGGGSNENSGYVSSACVVSGSNSTGTTSSTAGFVVTTGLSAATAVSGTVTLVNVSGNTWVASGSLGANSAFFYGSGGTKTTNNALDRVLITTTNGTDGFDAGSVNILYE